MMMGRTMAETNPKAKITMIVKKIFSPESIFVSFQKPKPLAGLSVL